MHLLHDLITAIAVMGLLSVIVGGVCLLERLFPDLDILGDRETRAQERLACHVLYRRHWSGNVEASPIDPPVLNHRNWRTGR